MLRARPGAAQTRENASGTPPKSRAVAKPAARRRAATASPAQQFAASFPAEFLRRQAHHQWARVVALYRSGDLRHPDAGGGMQALLDHRAVTVRKLLDAVKAETELYARAYWQRAAFEHATAGGTAAHGDVAVYVGDFLAQIEPLRSEAPGSTTPTSDLDVSLQGACTEWAVRRFNALFAELHDGNESGVVFDTNLYAADFIPLNKDTEFGKGADDEDRLSVPMRLDHAFTLPDAKRADDADQEAAALLHMRRYMRESDWAAFGRLLGRRGAPLRRLLDEVDLHYRRNRTAIAARILAGADAGAAARLRAAATAAAQQQRASVHIPPAPGDAWPAAVSQAVIGDEAVTPNARMAAENRLYEERLDGVADKRRTFMLLQFDLARTQARAAGGPLTPRDIEPCDRAYLALRKAISDACYFANECYATAGAKIQVVGGKQKWSKGVAPGKLDKAHRRNIDYTPQMLLHSLLEQAGDLFKEIRHHPSDDLGGAALAASKYLHRWFNAMKSLYRLVGTGRGCPPGFPNAAVFERVRRACGYGLEMLKRLPPAAADAPELEQHLRDLARRLDGDDARWRELGKDPSATALRVVREQFGRLEGRATFTGRDTESLLKAILLVTTGIVLEFHDAQAATGPVSGRSRRLANSDGGRQP